MIADRQEREQMLKARHDLQAKLADAGEAPRGWQNDVQGRTAGV